MSRAVAEVIALMGVTVDPVVSPAADDVPRSAGVLR